MTAVTIERTRVIEAPADRAWEVVADLDGYHQHVGGLAATNVVSGTGAGATRHCIDTSGGDWYETCDVWEPGSHYSVTVDVSTYPWRYRMLFSSFRGTWTVSPEGTDSRIAMRFDATLRRIPFVRRLVDRLVARSQADLDRILESYAAAAATP